MPLVTVPDVPPQLIHRSGRHHARNERQVAGESQGPAGADGSFSRVVDNSGAWEAEAGKERLHA
jgi:hypothetical protein